MLEAAWYKLNDNAASPTVVETVNGWNGRISDTAGASINSDVCATAGLFPNSTGALNLNYYAIIDTTGSSAVQFGDGTNDSAFSIAFWANCLNMDGDKYLMAKWQQAGGNRNWGVRFQKNVDGVSSFLTFTRYDESSSVISTVRTSELFLQDTTYHIALTYDGSGSGNGVTFYKNGVATTSNVVIDVAGYVAMEPSTADVIVGARQNQLTKAFSNQSRSIMDDARLYDYVLTQDQIDFLYNGGNGTRYPLQFSSLPFGAVAPLPFRVR